MRAQAVASRWPHRWQHWAYRHLVALGGACNILMLVAANIVGFAIDVDGDFDVDFVAGNGEDNAVAWYANDGYEDFTKFSITDSTQASSYQATSVADVFSIDVDGDGDIDVLSASFDDDKIAW